MSVRILKSAFTSGEISPLMDARVDAERYAAGCRKLVNFMPRVYGGAFRRQGLLHVGETGHGGNPVRIMPLNVSANDRYILEFGHQYLRIWNPDGTPFIDKVNSPYTDILELATPYHADDLFEIQTAQLANLCYFCHPKYPPQKLTRSFDASFNAAVFAWSALNFAFPVFRDTNQTDATAKPSATTGNDITIEFSENVFRETMQYSLYAGARIMLSQRRAAALVSMDLTSTADSDSLHVLGDYQLYTFGAYTGTLTIQEKNENGDWVAVRSFESKSDRQIVFNSFTEKPVELRLSYDHSSGSTGTAYLEAADSRRVGYARIKTGIQFADSKPVVECAVEEPFDSTDETTEWAIESFAPYAGYPRTVAFHEQRLFFGGTELQPNTFWASHINDFENFRRGSFDSDSLAFTLAALEGSAIQSLLSHDALVIFTQSEEWTATTSEQTAITPSNVFVRRRSNFGSAHREALVAAGSILFWQRGGRKLREFVYDIEGESGKAADLTLLAEHMMVSGIRQTGFASSPDPVLWAVAGNGELLALAFEPDHGIVAWSRHSTAGSIESVAVIYGDVADETWVVVRRGDRRFIERFAQPTADPARMVHLDAAEVAEFFEPKTDFHGFGHLEGQEVEILADGGVEPPQTVVGGKITLQQPARVLVAGLPFVSVLQPAKFEVPLDDGTAQGRKFVCKKVTLNLWRTGSLQYYNNPEAPEDKWFDAVLRSTDDDLGEAAALFTGMVEVNNLGRHEENIDFTLRCDTPLPANVLAMIPKFDVLGS